MRTRIAASPCDHQGRGSRVRGLPGRAPGRCSPGQCQARTPPAAPEQITNAAGVLHACQLADIPELELAKQAKDFYKASARQGGLFQAINRHLASGRAVLCGHRDREHASRRGHRLRSTREIENRCGLPSAHRGGALPAVGGHVHWWRRVDRAVRSGRRCSGCARGRHRRRRGV